MHFFLEGGWPMYPITMLGVVAIGLAIAHAASPARSLFWASLGVELGGLFMGISGTVLGLVHSFAAVAGVEPEMKSRALAQGITESMTCTTFALALAIVWLPLLLTGVFRGRSRARANPTK